MVRFFFDFFFQKLKNFYNIISLKGENFGSTTCLNEVYIGNKKCNITESSSTQISCVLGKNSQLVANVTHYVEVLVKNIGFAVHSKSFAVKFIPVVLSVSSKQGSLYGGNRFGIEGDGCVPVLTAFTLGS